MTSVRESPTLARCAHISRFVMNFFPRARASSSVGPSTSNVKTDPKQFGRKYLRVYVPRRAGRRGAAAAFDVGYSVARLREKKAFGAGMRVLLRELVRGVRRERRRQDRTLLYHRVFVEPRGQRVGVLVVRLAPQRERLQPLNQLERVEGRDAAAHVS